MYIQKVILRLKFDSVQDHLRSDGTVLVQNQLVPWSEESKREVLAVACECWCSFLAAGSPWLSGQAVSHMKLELGNVSLRFHFMGLYRTVHQREWPRCNEVLCLAR